MDGDHARNLFGMVVLISMLPFLFIAFAKGFWFVDSQNGVATDL